MSSYTYQYPRPCVSADCVVLAMQNESLRVLLIQRGNDPFKGQWALPGGFLDMDENLDQAAKRELEEETGLSGVNVQQFHAYGDVGRDPRARVISIAYAAMVRIERHQAAAADDAVDARWFPVRRLPRLAFDHREIVKQLMQSLKRRSRCRPFGLDLLPRKFNMDELLAVYRAIVGPEVSRRRLKSQFSRLGLLVESGKGQFRFDRRKYRAAVNSGCSLNLQG